jgi:hypothetical protein
MASRWNKLLADMILHMAGFHARATLGNEFNRHILRDIQISRRVLARNSGGRGDQSAVYLGRTTAGHPFVKVHTKSIGSYKINLCVRGSIAKLDS